MVQPFYWEVGDASGALAGASVNAAGSTTTYNAATVMGIASASKWLYAGYVVERKAGALNADDIEYLNFRSGYTNFTSCQPGQTLGSCVAYLTNGDYTAANDGKFFYGGGHMQKHAGLLGLDTLGSAALATELRSQLGTDIVFGYSQPQLAGGVVTSADNYARYLRKLLGGQLRIGAALASNGIGHWIEDDPVAGDGAFSSPGAFGFYP